MPAYVYPVIQEFTSLLSDCAFDLQVPPRDIQYAQFISWLKDDREADAEILKEFKRSVAKFGGFQTIRDSMFPADPTPTGIERQGLRDKAGVERARDRLLARDQVFLRTLESTLQRALPKLKVEVKGFALKPSKEKVHRILTVFLSDLHIGARLAEEETLSSFGPVEASRRLARVVDAVLSYKRDYRDETTLHVFLAGDIIQGMLGHDPRDGEPLTDQWTEALYLLTHVLAHFAAGFPRVKVFCTPGNHDRNISRHKGRAIHGKVDSFATQLYVALKGKFSEHKNVEFFIPRTPWVEVPVFSERLYLSHGDTNLSVPNPNGSINTKMLEQQMNRINIGEQQMGRKPFRAFAIGHVHIGGYFSIPGGYELITNPALLPRDGYGLQFGHGQACGQTIWEATPKFVVGDFRRIDLDPHVDQDKALDLLIKPYRGW